MPITVMDTCAIVHEEVALAASRTLTLSLGAAVIAALAVGYAFTRSAGTVPDGTMPLAEQQPGGIVRPEDAEVPLDLDLRDPLPVPERALKKLATGSLDDLSPEDRAAYDEYVSKAEATVRDNASALRQLLERSLQALIASDVDALATMAAADEGITAQTVAERRLAAQPKLVSATPLPSVQIRALGTTTVYLAFATVVWHDGGIDSEHTISIPLRYTARGWRLTTLDPLSDQHSVEVSQVTNVW